LGEAFCVPEEQIVLRYRSVIEKKHDRYARYLVQGQVGGADSFVIAVNGAKVPFSRPDADPPYIVKAVLPYGDPAHVVDWRSKTVAWSGFSARPEIVKKTGGHVSTRILLDQRYAEISGILFSCADVWKPRARDGTEFILVHNPGAVNPLAMGWLRTGTEYWIQEGTLKRRSWNVPDTATETGRSLE
jgi:type I restriction enzyme S subunit